METPKPGDIVRLKSGGVKMTLTAVVQYGGKKYQTGLCQWFDTKGEHHSAEVPMEGLEVAAE